MAKKRQRREALGVSLIALGLLVGLALVSPGVTGGSNWIGPAGALIYDVLSFAFGPLSPVLALSTVVWGAYCMAWTDRRRALRWSLLPPGLSIVVSALLWLLLVRDPGAPPPAADLGWFGVSAGSGLRAVFGRLGASLIGLTLLFLTLVVALGWSLADAGAIAGRLGKRLLAVVAAVCRGLFRLLGKALRAGGRLVRAAAADLSERRERYRARRGEPAGDAPIRDGGDGGEAAGRQYAKEGQEARSSGRDSRQGREAAGGGGAGSEPEGVAGEEKDEEPALPDSGDPSLAVVPPLELFDRPAKESGRPGARDLRELGDILIEKLATFRVAGEIGGWTTGPVVTQFEIIPAPGVKVGQISARADDIALALKAPSVRIVAPIPGKGAVGVEVPNPASEMVTIREVLDSPSYRGRRHRLPLAMGRDLSGKPLCADLTRMPHLLIAGQTGSGKSVCINALITSLVCRYTPAELRLLMVDPKMVELSVYGDLPHLRHPVITDNEEAASVLRWAVHEMKRRLGLLSANGCRNIDEFNRRIEQGRETCLPNRSDFAPPDPYEEGPLPFVVLVIDELADLMMTVQSEVERPLAMLAQKARAVGIHLILATQRPSVNVLTGLIKANIPSRISFRVASKIDSRTILDQNGAESLLGNGDMLFLPPGESNPIRIQGAFISSDETERLLDWYRKQAEEAAQAEEAGELEAAEQDILKMLKEIEEGEGDVAKSEAAGDRDDLFREAAEIVISHSAGSTSLLQRRLRIGYGRAARIIDQLHAAGIVGPADGSKPREVLVTSIELDGLGDSVQDDS